MATIPLPLFHPLPTAMVIDEDDPTVLEINAFRMDINQFTTAAATTLALGNPTHGFNQNIPGPPAANASQANHVTRLANLCTFVQGYYNVYSQAHANFVALIASTMIVPPPPAAPPHWAPKSNLPAEFMGKSPTEACHFIQQCSNYIAIQQFPDPETKIWFVLGLCASDAAKWSHEQLMVMSLAGVPALAHLLDFNDFVDKFA